MYLLDTDTCVAILRGDDAVALRLRELSPDTLLYTTVINAAELLYGARCASQPERERGRVESLLARVELLPLTSEALETTVETKYRLRLTGTLIPDIDLFIASISRQHGLTLVSHNLRHYQRIPDLKVIDWLAA